MKVMDSESNPELARQVETGSLAGMVRICLALPCLMSLSACVTERTVTDGSGRVIYQDTGARSPFESGKQKQREVEEKERQLGLDGTAI